MGREIDERVVQMKFENGQFEKGISTSIRSMEELKKGMNFDEAVKGFDKLDRSARSVKMDGLAAGVEAVRVKFDLLQITAFNVLNRISNKAIDTGERLVKSLTIEQISVGWDKFAEKTGAVQTIMAATSKQFTDTGEQMSYVNEQLDKLNWFTDETSYNFVDMVNNIGKFTSNNIALDESVTAMQGIANWAAISGANAGEASRAMYNMSQSMSAGAMKLQDWISIENANMGTAAFKEMAIQMALTAGTLKRNGDKIVTVNKGIEVSVEKFRDTLSAGWLDKNVMMNTLNEYGQATNKLNKWITELSKAEEDHADLLTSDLVAAIDDFQTGSKTAEQIAKDWGISLEKTQEILNDFSSDTDKFGLKAFKAAQEAKTFEDAINSVKDAVSTGWMKSFEYIFGDYLEAKEFFTDLANTLYDIFAAGSVARNNMLKEWKDQGGRDMFVDTIWAGLAAILSILKPIQLAWTDVFGEMTAERLLNITKSINSFVTSLASIGKTNIPRFTRIFRGLFAVLDIGITLLRSFGRAAASVVKALFPFGSTILDGAASLGDMLVNLDAIIKETKIFDKVFGTAADAIIFLINTLKSFGVAIRDTFSNVTWLNDAEKPLFSITNAFEHLGNSFSTIGIWISSVIESIVTSFKDGEISIGSISSKISDAINNLVNPFSGGSFDAILDIVNSGVFVTLLLQIQKFIRQLTSTNPAKIFESTASAMLDFREAILTFSSKIQTESFKNIASGLLILSAALLVLSSINPERLTDSLAALTILFVELGVAMKAFMKMLSFGGDSIKGGLKTLMDSFASTQLLTFMLGFSASIVILSGALKMLSSVDMVSMYASLSAIMFLMAGLATSVKILTTASKETKNIKTSFVFVLSLAAAISILSGSVSKLSQLNMEQLASGLIAVSVLIGGLTASIRLLTTAEKGIKRIKTSFIFLLSFAGAITILANAVAKLSQINMDQLAAGLISVGALMLGVYVFMSKLDGNKMSLRSSILILSMAASMQILSGAVISLGQLNTESLASSLIAVGALLSEIGIFMAAIGKTGDGNAKGLIKLSASLFIVASGIRILTEALSNIGDLSIEELAKGLIGVGVSIAAISASLKWLSSGNTTGSSMLAIAVSITVFAAAIRLLVPALQALGSLSLLQLVKSLGSLAAILAILGGGSYLLKPLIPTMNSLTVVMIKFGVAALALGAGISLLATGLAALGPAAIVGVGGLSVAILEVVKLIPVIVDELGLAVMAICDVIIAASPKIAEAFVTLVTAGLDALSESVPLIVDKVLEIIQKVIQVLISKIPSIVVSFGDLFKGLSVEGVKQLAIAISLILGTIVGSLKILQKSKGVSAGAIVSLGLLVGVATLIGVMLAKLSSIPNPVSLVPLAEAIGLVFLALSASMTILSKLEKGLSGGVLISLGALTVVAGAIGLVLAAFSNFTDPVRIIPLAAGLSTVMLSLAATMRIISGIQGDIGVNVGMLTILAIITGLMGAVLAGLSNITNPDTVLPIALGLSAVMVALGVVVKLLAATPPAFLSGAWSSLAMMGVIVAAMGALTVALGELMQLPGFKQVLTDGGEGMKLLGKAIGGFIGGIVGGVVEGALSFIPTIGTYLSDFMTNAQGFFDGVKTIPPNIGDTIGSLVVALLALTGAELLNGFANFYNSIFGTKDADLAGKFKTFGEAITAFSTALGDDFDAAKVESAANAGKALADLEAALPGQGGKLQEWIGEKNLADFGLRLMAFGTAMRGFGIIVKDLPVEAVEAAANAGMALANLENSLPAQGGKLQEWIGEKNIADFGTRIVSFGVALRAFAVTVKGITAEDVQGAVNAGLLLADLENNLPATDGLLQKFLGEQNLGTFGTRLTSFGSGLKGFSDAISQNGGLDYDAIKLATDAVGALVAMESQIDTSGGWGELFTGTSDFSSFGKHLEDLGGALKSYNTAISAIVLDKINDVNLALTDILGIAATPTETFQGLVTLSDKIKEFAPSIGIWSSNVSTAETDKMDTVTKEIEKLLKLSELNDAATWITRTVAHANLMVLRLTQALAQKHDQLKESGRSIAYWLIKGVTDGINDYQFLANNAATKLGEKVDQSVRDALQVASPSVKMIEVGHWVVKGLAEGITKDMSAEEAAEKKANNIVAAFQSVFDRIDLIAKNRSLQYELWEVDEGRNATDAEKQQRQLEDKTAQLQDAADKVAAQRAAFEVAKKSFAEGSDQYIEAENRVLEAMKSMYELRNEIDELQGIVMSGGNGLGSDAFKAYRKYIEFYQGSLDMLGWTQEELVQKAKEASGYGMETTKKGAIDTESIIASAFSDQKVDIATEPIKQKVRSSGTSIAQAGVDAAVEELGGDSTVEKVVDTVSGVVEKATKGEGKELLDSVISTTSDYVKPALENTTKQIGSGFVNSLGNSFAAVKEKYAGEVTGMMQAGDKAAGINSPSKWTYQSGIYIGQGLINGLNEVMPSCTQAGTSVGVNTVDGLTKGIEERGKIAIAAAQQVASKVASIMSSTLQIASPSKLTRSFGNYLDEGLALGLRDGLGDVEDASKEVANSTLSALDYAKDLINDVLESDDDFSPTITPVLNLDEVNRQAPGIRRALNRGGIDLSSTRRQAGFIDQYVSERQNGSTQAPAQTNYNFTQNNYSPKALNKAEIYRQTNNQFSRLKGASQR